MWIYAPHHDRVTYLFPERNCAFHVPGHIAMLSSEIERVAVPPSTIVAPGIGVVPNVLLPLAGPEEYDLEVGAI